MTLSSHRAVEPVSLPTNGDTCVCKFRDAIVCILSDDQQQDGDEPTENDLRDTSITGVSEVSLSI